MKIILNSDKEHVALIREKLKENDNFCPCSLFKTINYKCMCQEFREQETEGYCHCKLYCKIKEENNEN